MMTKRILVIPDIHGRTFWEEPLKRYKAGEFSEVVFLGDYFDPYQRLESITEEDAIKNYIKLESRIDDGCTLLLGNHDLPYYSTEYKDAIWYHDRYSNKHHEEIEDFFNRMRPRFKVAYTTRGILFTHAGCLSDWIELVFPGYLEENKELDLSDLVNKLNSLLTNTEDLLSLHCISRSRGGRDRDGSCVWADKSEMYWWESALKQEDYLITPLHKVKQIFGHSLMAWQNEDGSIGFNDKPLEYLNLKMLDTRTAYALDPEKFEIEQL